MTRPRWTTWLAGLVLVVAPLVGSALARPGAPFDDVPPCHWAAEAVSEVAGLGIFVGFPRDDATLSVNALRQVFEGLRCADADWSLRFLWGAPTEFGLQEHAALRGFDLSATLQDLQADRAVVAFTLSLVLDDGVAERIETLAGTATLQRDDDSWRVRYDDLAALGLPLFP
jgi:hypothetical protein